MKKMILKRKNILLKIFAASLLVSCCEHANLVKEEKNETNNNKDITSYKIIFWNDIFLQNDLKYFVYVFSYDCYFCNQTKECISKLNTCSMLPLYLIEFNKEIPIKYEIEKTIKATSNEDLFIRGTPTLILINNKKVELNVAGKNDVCSTIDLFSI